MSTKLGTLTLDLVAKIGQFVGPVKEAEKQTQASFDKMRKHVNTYGAAIAGVAASAAVGLAGMAVQTANQAAELEKFAFRANTTTQEFQKMAAGAGAFGIEQEKLSDMMKDFNEKLGELTAIGAGGGVDFFEKIAVKTEGSAEAAEELILKMQKLSGPEALQLYVDKLEEAGVTQQQMSFYLESMASDMTDLIPLLVNGGEGMRLYGDLAERAGIIMTDETIEAAKTLKDQVYMLDLQMQGAKNQLMQAVIPAFVDIAEAFFGGSEQGLQFTEVANGVAKTLKGVAATAIGAVTAIQLVGKALGGMAAIGGAIWNEMDWYEMNPIGIAKAAYEARGEIAALTSEIKTDMHSTVMGAAERLDRMWNSGTSEQAQQLRGIRELNQGVGNTNSGLSELAAKQNESADATRKNAEANSKFNRILEEQKRIVFDYSTEIDQRKLALDDEIYRLESNGMSQYVELAKARYAEEKKLAEMQFGWEIAEHRFTEQQKLEYSYNIKHQEVMADAKLTRQQREAKLQSLREQYSQETRLFKLGQEKQLLETKRHWMTAGEYAREYYALVREEILSTPGYSPEMRDALIKRANIQQGVEENAERERVWGDYQSMMGLEKSPYQQDMDLLAEARAQMLITEEEYQQQRLGMQMAYGAQYGADFAGMMMGLVDSSSSAYAVLAGVQKGFALFSTAMNSYTAISAAWASAPFPYNLPAVGIATMETGLLQAAVSALSPVGMAHNGIDNIPKEGTWLLDGGERVLNPQQNKDLTNYLSQAQTGGQQSQGQQFTIINQIEQDDLVGNYMRGAAGGQIVLNLIKTNPSEFKRALGV